MAETKEVKVKAELKGHPVPVAGMKTKKEKQAAQKLKKQAEKIFNDFSPFNPGGAPYSQDFIMAALEQGLNPKDVKAILNSQALGGPQTGPEFSSSELLDYFTDNPGEIGSLLEAVKASANAPDTYAEYLAQGGQPGGYQSSNQILQAAVLGIGGAKDAYMAGTSYQQYLNEGNDPNRWYQDRWDWLAERKGEQQGGGGGPSFIGGFDVPGAGYDDMNQFGMGDVLQMMQAARARRTAAESGSFFSQEELQSGTEQ